MSSELEEVQDIAAAIPEAAPSDFSQGPIQEDIVISSISFYERLAAFQEEFVGFVKEVIIEKHGDSSFPFPFWFTMVASTVFYDKLEELAHKHFRGIVYTDSLERFNNFVKQMTYAISALICVVKEDDLSTILAFVENFCERSFEEIDEWNKALTRKNRNNLQPYREKDLAAEEDKEAKR